MYGNIYKNMSKIEVWWNDEIKDRYSRKYVRGRVREKWISDRLDEGHHNWVMTPHGPQTWHDQQLFPIEWHLYYFDNKYVFSNCHFEKKSII